MNLIGVLSVIGGIMTAVNQTLVRKKLWIGWALALPNICLFSFVNYQAGAFGYAFILGPFWFLNALLAIRDWRKPNPLAVALSDLVQLAEALGQTHHRHTERARALLQGP
jgi:hypothetical protein